MGNRKVSGEGEGVTAKDTVISPDFLVWKFLWKGTVPHSFGRFAQLINYSKQPLIYCVIKCIAVQRQSLKIS